MSDEIMLSVCVPVYNHSRYIERCMRSLASQKTNFRFEVLVGEDCSPDDSREVLKRIHPEMPDDFYFLYREHNLGGAGLGNGEDLFSRVRGKYLLNLEGDDFLVYDGMLQDAVDFLESHPDYSAIAANCVVVGDDSEPNGEKYPECPDDEYSFREYFYGCLPGHGCTIVSRAEQFMGDRDKFLALAEYDSYAGDRRNAFTFLVAGKVRCVQQVWGAYRHVTKGGSSYSANLKKDRHFAENEVLFGKALVAYAQKYGTSEALETAKQVYYKNRFRFCFGPAKYEGLGTVLSDLKREKGKAKLLWAPFRWCIVLASRAARGRAII